MSTHTEVILRALATYDNPAFGPGEVLRIINENQDSFQAGAPYPDAFYNTLCQEGNFHGRFMVSIPIIFFPIITNFFHAYLMQGFQKYARN